MRLNLGDWLPMIRGHFSNIHSLLLVPGAPLPARGQKTLFFNLLKMYPMEPTANAPRSPDTRKPPSIPRADSAPGEPLSSWYGPGTAYRVTPRPAVASQPSAQPPSQAEAVVPAAAAQQPTPQSPVNWLLIGVAAICLLLGALLATLWKYWPSNNPGDVPAAIQEPSPQPPVHAQFSDSPADSGVIVTQEPMDDEPLPVVPSEPAPAQPMAEPREMGASADQAPAADTIAQAPPVQTQKPATPTLPVIAPPKPHPVPSPPMTIVDRKPVAPAKPRSAPVPAAVGTLIVAVQPWAEVWVDGKKHGISPPLLKLQLSPGSHRVELRNPDLPSYSQQLQISAGQSVTLRHTFQ
ncbi:PEGA domain-containing protein [Pseudomonas pseudonitroreducens]|uniref:PEGA domain-containing protein n=1 Tax=Pseudomonas pseudonitroreducens TaxID=2892326 RepID=UPI001F40B5E1|nr:PEGA domain-containing protein [Pseudomonas pseudonitroreducens]